MDKFITTVFGVPKEFKPADEKANTTISKINKKITIYNHEISRIEAQCESYRNRDLEEFEEDTLKLLLAEKRDYEILRRNLIDQKLILKKSINHYDSTKDLQEITTNLTELNSATKELKTTEVDNIDTIMDDLNEILEDGNEKSQSLTSNNLYTPYKTEDLLTKFKNEKPQKIHTNPIPTKPITIKSNKGVQLNNHEDEDDDLKILDSITVPPNSFKAKLRAQQQNNKINLW